MGVYIVRPRVCLQSIGYCVRHSPAVRFSTCSSRQGTLLAIGCLDGNIVIYDFIAKAVSRTIQAHVYLVQSLSWSNAGDAFVSCSSDGSICIWSATTSQCLLRLCSFEICPSHVCFHPSDSNLILIDFVGHRPALVNRQKYQTRGSFYHILSDGTKSASSANGWTSIFDHDGQFIITGNAQGELHVFSTTPALEMIQSGPIDPSRHCAVRQLCLSARSTHLAVLSLDKIRLYDWKTLVKPRSHVAFQCQHVLVDRVTKTKFMRMSFFSDGESSLMFELPLRGQYDDQPCSIRNPNMMSRRDEIVIYRIYLVCIARRMTIMLPALLFGGARIEYDNDVYPECPPRVRIFPDATDRFLSLGEYRFALGVIAIDVN